MTPLHLAQYRVLILEVANVSPHGQVLDEHFEEVIVVNRLLEFRKFLRAQRSLAQQAPFDVVLERQLVGRRLATISRDGLAEALLVAFGADAIGHDALAGRQGRDVVVAVGPGGELVLEGLLVFILAGVAVAEGEGVVAVRFGGVVEGAGG